MSNSRGTEAHHSNEGNRNPKPAALKVTAGGYFLLVCRAAEQTILGLAAP